MQSGDALDVCYCNGKDEGECVQDGSMWFKVGYVFVQGTELTETTSSTSTSSTTTSGPIIMGTSSRFVSTTRSDTLSHDISVSPNASTVTTLVSWTWTTSSTPAAGSHSTSTVTLTSTSTSVGTGIVPAVFAAAGTEAEESSSDTESDLAGSGGLVLVAIAVGGVILMGVVAIWTIKFLLPKLGHLGKPGKDDRVGSNSYQSGDFDHMKNDSGGKLHRIMIHVDKLKSSKSKSHVTAEKWSKEKTLLQII